MDLYSNSLYLDDLQYTAALNLPWELMQNKCILISGATGLVGSFLVDVLMVKNERGLNCKVYTLGRNARKAESRFTKWKDSPLFQFIPCDINKPLLLPELDKVSYVLHMASNTHPMQYATDPIGTITTNIIGLQHMLDFAVEHRSERFAFTSSNEIYGENRGDVELFKEDYCGYIDSNTLRAGYPESKRCGEALCQAYKSQKGLDIVIPRPTRSYGPTMLMSDTKAISQFIKKGIRGEDIVLKSAGTQYYSYTYVADTVSGLLTILLKGVNGEAYNIADEQSDIMLKELAKIIAVQVGKKVINDLPDKEEALGYSKATKARLNGEKLKQLGWKARFDIETGIDRTLNILMSCSMPRGDATK